MTEAVASNENKSLIYGSKNIDYSLYYSERRTLEIAVHPDCKVIVKAPIGSSLSKIEKKINKRARWILNQLNYFAQFTPKTPRRFYVNGETHLYLGKQYRLKISQGDKDCVKLAKGFFQITCRDEPSSEKVKKLLNKWYANKASIQFNLSMDRCWPKIKKFGFAKPQVFIKRMQKRWGSLSDKGIVTLNPDLVKAPKDCIDYVVIHELCHLKFLNHSPEFYKLLDAMMPEWEKIKHKLELSLA